MKRTGWWRRALVCVAVLMMAALVASCSSGGDASVPSLGDGMPAQDGGEAALPQEDGGDTVGEEERRIIRTKTMRLEVDDTPDAVEAIRDLTRTHSGTVSDMQLATDSEQWVYREASDGSALRGWLTVRVPTDVYEDFVTEVAQLGVVTFQSEATSDVTQEHVDMSARLDNLRAQEARLREFFDAADDVDDMLAIEKELGRVRGEIESLDAQVTYLERQASMATITVELTEPRAVVRPGGESWGFVEAVTEGFRGAAQLMAGLMTFLIASAPLWIIGAVVFLVVRVVLRRRRRVHGKGTPVQKTSPVRDPRAANTAEETGSAERQ